MDNVRSAVNGAKRKRYFMHHYKRYFERLLFNQLMIKGAMMQGEGAYFCECAKFKMSQSIEQNFGRAYLEEILIILFFELMIDQTLYFILVDGRINPNCLNEPDVYEDYDNTFGFFKFHNHFGSGYASPISFLSFRNDDLDICLLDKTGQLRKTKNHLWDNMVRKYFFAAGRKDIIQFCEDEFRRDLTLRHRYNMEEEAKLKSLFEKASKSAFA